MHLAHRRRALLFLVPVVALAAACGSTVVSGVDHDPSSSSTGGSTSSSMNATVTSSSSGGGDGVGGSTSTCVPQCTLGDSQPPTCCLSFPCPTSSSSSSGSSSSGGTETMCCEGMTTTSCTLVDGCPTWTTTECDTPLVLVFDGAPVDFIADGERADHAFRLNATRDTTTDWPSARTPWLALDRDGNRSIDDGAELFGSMTVVSGGRGRAKDGFEALRDLDTDGDGRITARDARFADLQLWSDADGDRRSAANELTSVESAGIVSIDLRDVSAPRCDARGNCEVERAPFVYRDARGALRTGEVVDVHLRAR